MKDISPQEILKYHRVLTKEDLYALRKGCKKWIPENIEPDIGAVYYIHSPFSNTVYKNAVSEFTNWDILNNYIRDGNVYVDRQDK